MQVLAFIFPFSVHIWKPTNLHLSLTALMYKTRLFSKSKLLEEVLITGPDVFSRYTGP